MATQQQSQPCLQSTPEATCCTIPHVHLFSTVPYVLNVTALHPSGASSSLLAFVAERISECLSFPPLSVPALHHAPPATPAAAPMSCQVPAAFFLLYSSLTDSLLPPQQPKLSYPKRLHSFVAWPS